MKKMIDIQCSFTLSSNVLIFMYACLFALQRTTVAAVDNNNGSQQSQKEEPSWGEGQKKCLPLMSTSLESLARSDPLLCRWTSMPADNYHCAIKIQFNNGEIELHSFATYSSFVPSPGLFISKAIYEFNVRQLLPNVTKTSPQLSNMDQLMKRHYHQTVPHYFHH